MVGWKAGLVGGHGKESRRAGTSTGTGVARDLLVKSRLVLSRLVVSSLLFSNAEKKHRSEDADPGSISRSRRRFMFGDQTRPDQTQTRTRTG